MAQITVADLIKPALRIAGITDRPGRTPSPDQIAEVIGILNKMTGSWNCDPLRPFRHRSDIYALTAGVKTYTIGGPDLGAAFDAARPQKITGANILLGTTPEQRKTVKVITDEREWREIAIQDLPSTIPWCLYNDQDFPLSTLYLVGQALSSSYRLELFTWQSLSKFEAMTDLVTLPDGYELAINFNLARLVAAHFPTQAVPLSNEVLTIARESLAAVESLNAPDPVMQCDSAVLLGGSGYFDYRTGE